MLTFNKTIFLPPTKFSPWQFWNIEIDAIFSLKVVLSSKIFSTSWWLYYKHEFGTILHEVFYKIIFQVISDTIYNLILWFFPIFGYFSIHFQTLYCFFQSVN